MDADIVVRINTRVLLSVYTFSVILKNIPSCDVGSITVSHRFAMHFGCCKSFQVLLLSQRSHAC